MNTPETRQRYASPSAEVADVRAEGELQPADRLLRFVGALIDTPILFAGYWVMSLITPWDLFAMSQLSAGFMTILGMQLLGLLVFVLVNGWLLATRGQTVAKMLLGMRIARPDGSAASFGRLIGLRYAVSYFIAGIPFAGFAILLVDCLFIFRNDRRCLHDLIADTIVVKL